MSTEHIARNNGITVVCLLVSLWGKCKSKNKKTTLSRSRGINDTPKALHIQERADYSINKCFTATRRED